MAFVQSTSEYMTTRARRVLQEFWRCPVEERYGLSEMFLGAWRCHICGGFHFEPYGLVEVVSVLNRLPLVSGRGELVLTGFYPFVQMTPLIRYVTGDLVHVKPDACPSGLASFWFLGRKSRSYCEGDAVIVGEYEIQEVLDDEPEVSRTPRYVALPHHLHEVGATPVFEVSRDQSGIGKVTIRIRFEPSQFPEKTDLLRNRIAHALKLRTGNSIIVCVSLAEQA
jgi:hypothetical protein